MTSYTFTVGATPKSQTGHLTWNSNGTLQQLAITDGFYPNVGTQTCNYGNPSAGVPGYDDLGRLISVDCGAAIWQQNFSYDPFGNITKMIPAGGTGLSWMPGYNQATNRYTLGGARYDGNGNLLNDTLHQYTWDADNHLLTVDSNTCGIDGTCLTNDAFGRVTEENAAGVYSEVLYSPIGKMAVMNARTATTIYVPMPGGATYTIGAANDFWHKDWQGSVRLASTRTNRTIDYDRAFAPFGESYNNVGSTTGFDFTGDTQDIVLGTYDTPNRELNRTQGRWISPDPAGLAAADFRNPQTWNRYGYVGNNPCSAIDPLGLDTCNFNVSVLSFLNDNVTSQIESRIAQIFSATATSNGDTVGVQFTNNTFLPGALNLLNSRGRDYGRTLRLPGDSGNPFLSYVNYQTVQGTWGSSSGPTAAGTVAAHELFHFLTGIGDVSFDGGPNLMSVDAAQADPTMSLLAKIDYADASVPGFSGFNSFSPEQADALYSACKSRVPGGRSGSGGPSSGGWGGMDEPAPFSVTYVSVWLGEGWGLDVIFGGGVGYYVQRK
jgi:RHS repeat-associated protein